MNLDRDQIENIAKVASKAAVEETLRVLGIDLSEPFEVQRDMAHLRAWRLSLQSMQLKAGLVIVTMAVTGIAAAMWTAIKWH